MYTAPRPTTHQEVFDIVARHMLTQNAKSRHPDDPDDTCAYRGEGGLMCAAGCLLDDDEVTDDNNALPWGSMNPERLSFAFGLVTALQRVHDGLPIVRWPKGLRDVAAACNLSAVVVDQMTGGV